MLGVLRLFELVLRFGHFLDFRVVAIGAAIKVAIDFSVFARIEPSFSYISVAITKVATVINVAIKRLPLPRFSPVKKLITLVT